VQVVDLSHAYHAGMPIFPGLPQPSFTPIARVEEDGYAMTDYHLLNHIGTHVDAPAHQILGGDTLDEIGLERLVTDAVTIDVSDLDPGPLTAGELEPHLADGKRRRHLHIQSRAAYTRMAGSSAGGCKGPPSPWGSPSSCASAP
jgi:arylformamidase